MSRTIETLIIQGPAGRLEAMLEEPEQAAPREIAVVCHPHPLYGGTMHNKVVHRLARGLRRSGVAVLRFNFRGVNRSQGVYDNGRGEIEDARACLEWLRNRYPGLPATLAGFSFGGLVALRLACRDAGAVRVIAAGFPTRAAAPAELESCRVPKVLLQSTHDQYGPKAELDERFARWAEPKRLLYIEAEDHFFRGSLDRFEEAVLSLGLAGPASQAPV